MFSSIHIAGVWNKLCFFTQSDFQLKPILVYFFFFSFWQQKKNRLFSPLTSHVLSLPLSFWIDVSETLIILEEAGSSWRGEKKLNSSSLQSAEGKTNTSISILEEIYAFSGKEFRSIVIDVAILCKGPSQRPNHRVFYKSICCRKQPPSFARQAQDPEVTHGDRIRHPKLSKSLGYFPLGETRGSS